MEYYSYLEAPRLDAYSVEHQPRPGLPAAVVSFTALLTDSSGATYSLLRAIGITRKDLATQLGLQRGRGSVDAAAELVIPFNEVPVTEPCWTERTRETVTFAGPSFRIELGADEITWRDAGGRIELTIERLGQDGLLWIPPQPAFPQGLADRNYLGRARGTIDGEPVEGLFIDDRNYTRPDIPYYELGLPRIELCWFGWLTEDEGGSCEAGTAWIGRPQRAVAHAHHYRDGISAIGLNPTVDLRRSGTRGAIERARLSLASGTTFEIEVRGYLDWPFHGYGTVSTSGSRAPIAKSWCFIESWPLNQEALEHHLRAHHQLYGRYPSLGRLLSDARIDEQILVATPP
jgi:hypothetical protein